MGGDLGSLHDLDGKGWVSGDKANVFVTNHDTERVSGSRCQGLSSMLTVFILVQNGNALTSKSSNNVYLLATIFSLAHPYGTPTVLSSYSFSDPDSGAPKKGRVTVCASCDITG